MTLPSSQKTYQKVITNSCEASCIFEKNSLVLFANKKFCKMLGYSLSELQTLKEEDLWDEKSKKNLQKLCAKKGKEVSINYEGVFLSKTGKKISVCGHRILLPQGQIIGIYTDLTESKNQESLYKKLVEHMNEGVWMCDENDYTIYANPKFCKMVEYSLKELQNIVEYKLWDEKTVEHVKWVNTHTRKAGVSTAYEGTLLSKSGKRIPVLLSGTPLPNGKGTMGMVTDLRELKKRESMYQTLIEKMNEPVILVDKKENIVYANPKFCSLTGYKLEDLIGKSEYNLWDTEAAKKVHKVNIQERKKGLSSKYEANLMTKKGKTIPVLVSGSALPDGGTMGILTNLQEIYKKEETERILSNSLRYTQDAIIVVDTAGKVQLWNKGAKRVFGYKKEEIEGCLLKTIFPKEDTESLLAHSKVLHNFELAGVHKNKNPILINATLTPLLSENRKKISAYVLIARDVTSTAKFEEELTLKYQKLKEAYNQFGIVRRHMDYAFELLEFANDSQDKKTIADYIVSSVIMLTHVDGCILRLYNEKKNTLDLLSYFGVLPDWRGTSTVHYKNSLTEKAMELGHPLKIIDVTKEIKYQSSSLAKKNNFCSLLLIPLKYKSLPLGVLYLYTTPEKKLEIFEDEFIERYAKVIEIVLGTVFC